MPTKKADPPKIECPQCGEDNNWREINNLESSTVYNCRCGGRLEVALDPA